MGLPLRVLHLEDDPNDAELVRHALADNDLPCSITRVDTGEAFKAALERERFDLILSDYNLPTVTGLDALKLAAALNPALPFIFVSGVMGEEFAVMTLQLGATDYVLKKNLARLPAAVRRALNEAEATATRTRMEESLRLHATRMKSLMDTSLDAIVVMDSGGVILDWNAQADIIFGWNKSEVVGRPVAEVIIPPQHREAHNQGMKRFLATGEGPVLNRRIEITALHRTGREFPVELAVTATKIHDLWQFTGFIIDATERKRAERRLAAQYAVTQVLAEAPSQEKAGAQILQVLCESLGWDVGGLWRVDQRAKLLRCIDFWHDPQFKAADFVADSRQRTFAPGVGMLGHVWNQGKPVWITDIGLAPAFPRTAMAAKAGLHGMVGFPVRIGKHIYGIIEFFSREAREPDPELMQMVDDIGIKIGQFIERKEAEEALHDSRQQYKLLVDHANDIIYRTDARGRLTFVNPMATRLMQYSEEELLRMRFTDVIRPDQRRAVERFYRKQLAEKAASSYYEFPALRKDGTEIWLEQNVQQLFEDGQVVGFQAVARDITERKNLEEINLAKLSAERANQAKSEFLSRMSHELRTPLNAVLGFAQLLEMEELRPDQQEHVQQILKGGRHLLTLVNEVLDIARIEAGRITLSLEPVSVSTVIQEAVDLIRPQAAARRIRLLTPAVQGKAVYVRAEQQHLKQVLVNLLSNGVKYNREGGTLTVTGQAVPDGRYRLTVTDTGGGIPPALLSRLFTPFDRLEADSQTEGTGLGLVLSRSLITVMGGTIFIESVVGQGTSVSVELPLSEPPAARISLVPDKVQVTAPVSGRTVTVLYIEDNQSNYQLVECLVEKRPGVKLIGAMLGKLGLELALAHRPDLILLDLNLPDIPGDEVLLRLRERPETAAIPVVMLSADAMQKQIDKLLAAGAKQYLTKPIEVAKFNTLLDDLITGKEGC